MRTLLLAALLLLSSCLTTYQVKPTNVATDNVIVLRKGYSGAGTRMRVFVDSQLVGKVLGYRYLSFSLPAGPHQVLFKFSPWVSRSATRSFAIAAVEKKVFTVRKGFFRYGVEVLESDTLPAGIGEKRRPKVQETK